MKIAVSKVRIAGSAIVSIKGDLLLVNHGSSKNGNIAILKPGSFILISFEVTSLQEVKKKFLSPIVIFCRQIAFLYSKSLISRSGAV